MAVPFLLSWLRLATSSSARFGAASPYLFVRKIPYVIASGAQWRGDEQCRNGSYAKRSDLHGFPHLKAVHFPENFCSVCG
jgi:hypothetical protein